MKRAISAVAALALVGGSVSLATAIPPSDPDPELVFIPVPHPEAPRPAETATPAAAATTAPVREGRPDTVGAERLHPLPTPAPSVPAVAPAVLAPQPAQVFTPAAGMIAANCARLWAATKRACLWVRSLLGARQFGCLYRLVWRESRWSVYAGEEAGAYGLPQALPGRKMAKFGADWRTNPTTQLRWMIAYVRARYDGPCPAYQHALRTGWY